MEENLHFFATVFGTSIRENYDLVRDIYSQIEPFRTRSDRSIVGGYEAETGTELRAHTQARGSVP